MRLPPTYLNLRANADNYFLHYTPDISGGVASWLKMFAQAFPDFMHLVLCARGLKTSPSVQLGREPNVYQVGHLDHQEAAFWARTLPKPMAILNHVFWDLKPITRADLEDSEISVWAFMRGVNSRLRCAAEAIDELVVFSSYYSEIYNYALPSDVIPIVLPHGINTDKFSFARPTYDQANFVLGNVTNGGEWKHSENFVEICRRIKSVIPVAEFRFLGAIDLVGQVEGLEGFDILPPYSVAIENYYSGINVLLHKTHSGETWCNVATEAMSSGIPIVAENRGGIKDQIIHGETGYLCNNGDDYIKYCKLLYDSKRLYHHVSKQARQHVEDNFSLESFRARVEEKLLRV